MDDFTRNQNTDMKTSRHPKTLTRTIPATKLRGRANSCPFKSEDADYTMKFHWTRHKEELLWILRTTRYETED